VQAHPPAQAYGLAAALDGTVVFFGGPDGYNTALQETWIVNGSSWSQLAASGPYMDYLRPSMVTLDRP
jgi:hypothetical protein